MILESTGDLTPTEDFIQYRWKEDVHYVSGFFYIAGFRAGEESCVQVQQALEKTGVPPFEQMRGAFHYCIRRRDGRTFLFSCNSNLHCLYVGGHAAATGFEELLRHLQMRGETVSFDMESLCECYTLGRVFFEKTLAEQISVLSNEKYILYTPAGSLEILDKGVSGLDGKSGVSDPAAYFSDIARAASGLRVAQALTGGYDSRMVFSQLNGQMPLSAFLATNLLDGAEYRYAKRVADAGGKDLRVFQTEKPALTEDLLTQLMEEADWAVPLSLDGDVRTHSFRRRLREEEFQLEFTGDGGVLHKDWEWMQDLPFYHRKGTNLKRFYHQRIAFEENAPALGPLLKDVYARQEERIIFQLRPYVRSINTQSYDMLYHYVTGDRRICYNRNTRSFSSFAPLLELDFLRRSYHLPRRSRFFYNFLREMTTAASPAIARIPTVYGTTASSEPLYLLRDIFFQLIDYGRKGVRMIGRQLFHKTFLNENVIEWSLENELRSLPMSGKAVAWAVQENLLDKSASVQTLPYAQLNRIVYFYMLMEHFHISVPNHT